jgi:hypothetical protein
MDDEKSITEKLADALGKATDSVKSTLSSIVDTASNAAQHAMESNAERISGQTVTELDSGQTARTSGQVYIPAATDAAAMPAPLFAAPAVAKPRKPRAKSRAGKTLAAPRKAPAKKSNKTPGKKIAKKPATKSAPSKSGKTSAKKTKKSAGKTTARKTARKAAKAKKKSKR